MADYLSKSNLQIKATIEIFLTTSVTMYFNFVYTNTMKSTAVIRVLTIQQIGNNEKYQRSKLDLILNCNLTFSSWQFYLIVISFYIPSSEQLRMLHFISHLNLM